MEGRKMGGFVSINKSCMARPEKIDAFSVTQSEDVPGQIVVTFVVGKATLHSEPFNSLDEAKAYLWKTLGVKLR
jgi:hypothetical protein